MEINTKCSCNKNGSNNCILNYCKKCCNIKNCNHNTKNKNLLTNENICSICDDDTENYLEDTNDNIFKHFFHSILNKNIYYCNNCDKKISDRFEKIFVNDFNLFLTKYKNTIITKEIFNNIKEHKKFSYTKFKKSNIKIECFKCLKIINCKKINKCLDCNDILCNKCVKKTEMKCWKRECYECISNTCEYNYNLNYCENCYVDYNKKFYDEYKNILITNEILKNLRYKINLRTMNFNYKMNFYCSECENITEFNFHNLSNCENCLDGKYYCNNCIKITEGYSDFDTTYHCIDCYNYFKIDEYSYYSDDHDDEESYYSYNEELKELNNKRAISPFEITDDIETRCDVCLTNKKNYACVPCGHLCLCGTCSKNINKKCPICNNEIDNIIIIFN